VRAVNPYDVRRYGMVTADPDGRVTYFEEKPRRTRSTLASMGIYVFNRQLLIEWLSGPGKKQRDFGREVIPALLEAGKRVYAFTFLGYWADVGTVQAFWEANTALLAETPALDLYDPEWVIHTKSEERPPVFFSPEAQVETSLLSDGAQVFGRVVRSVLSPGVYVAPGAEVRDSIIFTDTVIESGAVVDRAIVDKDVVIGAGAKVGFGEDNTPNHEQPTVLNTGITLVGKGAQIPPDVVIGRNCVVHPYAQPRHFKQKEVPSGTTIGA